MSGGEVGRKNGRKKDLNNNKRNGREIPQGERDNNGQVENRISTQECGSDKSIRHDR